MLAGCLTIDATLSDLFFRASDQKKKKEKKRKKSKKRRKKKERRKKHEQVRFLRASDQKKIINA